MEKLMKDYYNDYRGWRAFLNGREKKKVCHETIVVDYCSSIGIFYHNSMIISIQENDFLVRNCGWETLTTKRRLNQFTPYGFKVFQKDWNWYMQDSSGDIRRFKESTRINDLGRFIT